MRFTAVAAASALALVLFACSGSDAPTSSTRGASSQNNNEQADSKTPSSTKSPTSSTTGSSTDSTEPAAGGSCSAKADQKSCYDCCDAQVPGGYQVLDQAFGDCMCAADACATACAASACAATPSEPAQGDACDTCLQQHGQACGQKAETACNADANCKKVLACEDSSKCADKPE